MNNILAVKTMYIQSQHADPSPPLGTVLGNLGLNTTNFCNDFNAYTKNLPIYFFLKVDIHIFTDKSIKFSVSLPNIGVLLRMLKFDKEFKIKKKGVFSIQKYPCVTLTSVLKLSKLKFPTLSLQNSFFMVLGTAKSMGIKVLR